MSREAFHNNLRAVTLDMWQTLLLDRPDLGAVRSALRIDGTLRLLTRAGVAVTREQVEEAYRRNYDAHWKMQEEARDFSFDEQVEAFLRCIDPSLPLQVDREVRRLIGERYSRPFIAYPAGLAPGARQTLEALKARGYKLGIISNTGMTPGRMLRDHLAELGVLGYFDALVFSDEVCLSKPAPGIFRRALEELGVEAAHAVHVGDSAYSDVGGAKGVGMGAVWLRGSDGAQPDVQPDATITRLWELADVV